MPANWTIIPARKQLLPKCCNRDSSGQQILGSAILKPNRGWEASKRKHNYTEEEKAIRRRKRRQITAAIYLGGTLASAVVSIFVLPKLMDKKLSKILNNAFADDDELKSESESANAEEETEVSDKCGNSA